MLEDTADSVVAEHHDDDFDGSDDVGVGLVSLRNALRLTEGPPQGGSADSKRYVYS